MIVIKSNDNNYEIKETEKDYIIYKNGENKGAN
jgi:hypothetical protein